MMVCQKQPLDPDSLQLPNTLQTLQNLAARNRDDWVYAAITSFEGHCLTPPCAIINIIHSMNQTFSLKPLAQGSYPVPFLSFNKSEVCISEQKIPYFSPRYTTLHFSSFLCCIDFRLGAPQGRDLSFV